ncbi:MAG: restriction endonuclease subunit S [Intestinimonas butyriciproducens]
MAADKRRSSFSSFVRSLNSCTRFPNLVALHGSSKPGKRSFGRFSRPLLEVYFQTSFRYEPKVKSLAVAEIFRYCKGFRLSYSYFCLLDQKYKRGLLNQIFSAISKGSQRRKLRELVHVSGGKTPSMSNSLYWNGDIVWISSKDMKSSRISGSELKITNLALNEMTLYHPGTLLLVARSGILKHSLPLAILEVDATINQDIKALQVHGCNAFYLYYAILSQEDNIIRTLVKTGTTVQSLMMDSFLNIEIPTPDIDLQQSIIDKLAKLEKYVDVQEEELSLLSQMRNGLLQQLFI